MYKYFQNTIQSLLHNCQSVFVQAYPKCGYAVNKVTRPTANQILNGRFYSNNSFKRSNQQIDKILNVYKGLAQNPILTSARILSAVKGRITLQSEWSQKNLELRKKQKFVRSFTYDQNLQLLTESFPSDISSELMFAQTEDENLKAILRRVMVNEKPKQFIKIWSKQHLIKSYDLSAFGVHGSIYSNATFGAFHFSPDNNKLLYVAEKKLPKSEPFYKQNKKFANGSAQSNTRGNEYIFKPDWGEMLTGKHRSVVVILDLKSDTLETVDSIPDDYFPSQVTWTPNGDIVGIVHKLHPRYLGLIMATNRESYIFHLKGSEFRTLTSKGLSCRSPRFSPDGKNLVWLEREISPVQLHVSRLAGIKWGASETPEILIDVVRRSKVISNNNKFYGLFNQYLSKRCWSDDSKYLFFCTPSRSTIKSYIFNLGTKEITEINSVGESSLTILDVRINVVTFKKSSLTQPHQLMFGRFDPSQKDFGNLRLLNCTTPCENSELDTLVYETTEFKYNNEDSVKDFNFTYLGKKDAPKKSVPLIVVIHGGPHLSLNNEFSLSHALLAQLGFGILLINYRGSAGMGGDNIEYILGKIGKSDVHDCITSINAALKKYPWLDSDKITVWGASYGGFISAHLSGQYPDMFKAVVMRNPVIELATMYSTTDTPDWCSSEAKTNNLGSLPENTPVANYPQVIQTMLKSSPIFYSDKVKAPTFIALSWNDQRVPSTQGKLWYYRLTANNVKTKLHIYNDNHALTKHEETDIDYVINSALWLIEHIDKEI